MRNGLKKQIISGLFWKFGERILAQGVSFVVSLVLARMLLPEEYGSIALVLVFINLANVFVSNGLGETSSFLESSLQEVIAIHTPIAIIGRNFHVFIFIAIKNYIYFLINQPI